MIQSLRNKSMAEIIHTLFVAKARHGFVQFFRYGFVGGLAAVVDIGSLYTFTSVFHVHYLISAAIAFILGTIVNYLLSVRWVFESSGRVKTEIALFTLIGVGGLALNELFMWLFVEYGGAHYVAAKLMALSLVMIWSFTLRRLLFARLGILLANRRVVRMLGMAQEKWGAAKTFVEKNPGKTVYIFFGLFVVLVYLPYLLYGGLVYDDWSVARLGRGCPGFIESFGCYWPNYAHRPLAPFYYSTTTNLFHDWAAGYIFVSVFVWIVGIVTVFRVLKRRFGLGFATPFLFIAATPSLASSILFSPGMQSVGALSFAIWAGSFYLLDTYVQSKNRKHLLVSLGLMLASLLFYESSLPLFALSLAWPYILRRGKTDVKYWKTYCKKYILPVFAIVLAVLVYQKVIIVKLQASLANLSKFQIIGSHINVLDFALRVLLCDAYIFTVGLLSFAGLGLVRIFSYSNKTWLNFLLLVVVLAVGLLVSRRYIKPKASFSGYYLLPVILGIGMMYFVSLAPPTFVGYSNRGMVAGSIVVALAGAMLWHRVAAKRTWAAVVCILLFSAYLSTFIVQRNNFIESNREKQRIQADVIAKLEPHKNERMYVLANVPTYLATNFNNETVFSDEVLDWAHFLYLKSGSNALMQGISLSEERLVRGELKFADGNLVALGEKVPLKDLWFYEASTKTLTKVQDEEQLRAIFKKAHRANSPAPVDGLVRNKLQQWLASY